jgi:hypothetical protein
MPRPRRTRRLYYRRSFLNRPGHHAGAYVIADVTLQRGTSGGLTVDGDLTIADCARVTSLDFYVASDASAAERRNALHKARVLRDVVNDFVEAFEAALAEARDPG